jgi:hypothetical protein
MIDLDSFYIAAGLLPPHEWEVQRLDSFRRDLFKKIPGFISGDNVIPLDFSRGSGKTTKILIEALHAEWHGYDTTIAYETVVEQYFAKYRYETFKKKIYSTYGPPLNAGKISMITNHAARHYKKESIIFDLK